MLSEQEQSRYQKTNINRDGNAEVLFRTIVIRYRLFADVGHG
jgi:hypothetical protein